MVVGHGQRISYRPVSAVHRTVRDCGADHLVAPGDGGTVVSVKRLRVRRHELYSVTVMFDKHGQVYPRPFQLRDLKVEEDQCQLKLQYLS